MADIVTFNSPSILSSSSIPYNKLFAHADVFDYVLMFVGGVGAIVHGIALPIFFIFFGKLIDSLGNLTIDPSTAPHAVNKYALYFIYLSLARFGSGWIEVCLWMYTGDRQSACIRGKYVKALITQDVSAYDIDISISNVVMGISRDTSRIQDAIGVKTGNLIHYFSQFVAGFVVAFCGLWKLTLLTLAVIPLIVASGGVYGYVMVELSNKSQQAYVMAGKILHEAITHIKSVQAFGGEEATNEAYERALRDGQRAGWRAGLAKGLGMGVIRGMGFACFSLLLWYAGRLVRNGDSSGGLAFTTILNVAASCLALVQAAPDLASISKAQVSAHSVFTVIDKKLSMMATRKEEDSGALTLERINGEIQFRDVNFSYPSRPHVNVFDGFSLCIPAGKMAAIVGSSGSGKSTIISLIERFYDPTSGDVLLDGYNIKNMQLKWLRDQMGLVNQEPCLFSTTIAENIRYGKLEGDQVSMDEVIEVAKISSAHDFINMLPNRYETQVGQRGAQLSGGQKQQIAIARAMLKHPSILLLDEATSALDSESEKSVQDAIVRVMFGRTTVVVAHRLSSIQNADMIVFVQNGRVLEVGSQKELLEKQGGAYAALVKQWDQPQESTKLSRNSYGSFSRSVSQRTYSFCSTTDIASVGMGLAMNVDDLAGSRPFYKRVIKISACQWQYGFLSAIGALAAGAQLPLFGLIITQALVYFNFPDGEYMKRGLTKVSLLCCGLSAMTVLAYTCEFYFSGIAGENLTVCFRKLMFSALLRNEISWYDQNSSTLLSSRLVLDAQLLTTVVVDRTITLFQNLGLVVTAFIITFNLQWKMASVMTATLPGLILSNLGQVQFAKGFSGDLNKAYMKANVVAAEAISDIRTVAAFSAEEKVMSMFTKELNDSQRKSFIRGQIGGIGFGASQLLLFSSYSLSLWYAGKLIIGGDSTFSEVMKCFMVMMITGFGMAEALGVAPDFLRGVDELRAAFHILDRQTEIDACDPKAEEMVEVKGAIEFKHVDFCYPTRMDVQIFKDLNLKIQQHQSLALVGQSGSGKSSLIALILRFYDPQHGRVMIDGKDVKLLRLKSLREHIGLVQQEPALFSTSIYKNIAYGNEAATEADIVKAAKVANAHGFISSLPEGYNTKVGERGLQLSGGQKQRVAIARAILRKPAILLLDEATSALDVESEKLVQEALDRLMFKRTTVIVAHRMSTIQSAQSIVVLQNGAITERGTHHELRAKQGVYFQLLNSCQAEARTLDLQANTK